MTADVATGTGAGKINDPGVNGGAPEGAEQPTDTRDRILNVALELFTDKGFDATSLREIAERLGFSKAALYYHYRSKEDIIMALHLRMHDVGKQGIDRLAEGPVNLETWETLLDSLLEEMVSQRALFLLHDRNRAALERLHDKDHDESHDDIQARLHQILSDPTISLRDRVRMACSFGAVFGALFIAGDAFQASSTDELAGLVRGAVHDILRP